MHIQRYLGLSLVLLVGHWIAAGLAVVHAAGLTLSYPINVPGSRATQATGIDSAGNIVGFFTDSAGATHGFVDRNGSFSQIDVPFPTAALTAAYSPSATGVIGRYLDGAGEHGFQLGQLGFLSVDVPFPDASSTDAYGTNSSGSIAGFYTDGMGHKHGFVDQAGTFGTVDFPGAISTLAFAIDGSGAVVGWYADSSFPVGIHGFIDRGGNFTDIDFPGATVTQVFGINSSGNLVGTYVDSSGTTHGFLEQGGVFTPIDVPGANETQALGLSDTGGIAGTYNDSTGTHGFEVVPAVSLGANQISATASGLVYSRVTKTYSGTVTIKNISSTTINGPFQIVFVALTPGVALVGPSGTFNSSPYTALSAASLAAGQSATISVQFNDPSNVPIHFAPAIYSGSLH